MNKEINKRSLAVFIGLFSIGIVLISAGELNQNHMVQSVLAHVGIVLAGSGLTTFLVKNI